MQDDSKKRNVQLQHKVLRFIKQNNTNTNILRLENTMQNPIVEKVINPNSQFMKFVFILLIGFIPFVCFGQQSNISDGRYALPENLVERPADFLGFPITEDEQNIHENFKNPPHGYGEIPFYWWTGGDTLTKERLQWQLDQLCEAGVLGLNVSYNHTNKVVDTIINKDKNVRFGMPEASNPAFQSEEWWDIWNWFSEECAKRNMGLGLDDYVIGDKGTGNWGSKVAANSLMQGYQGQLKVHKPLSLDNKNWTEISIPSTVVSAMAYPKTRDLYDGTKGINLLPFAVGNKINWKAPTRENWEAIIISTESSYMLHPEHGNLLVNTYFQEFENRLSPEGRKGMNFFFQDELIVDINNNTWSQDFAQIFKEKKGYDILPILPALYFNIGDISPKVRLDYYDVMIELAEERYFKPVFEWHWQRGMLMGCDNEGRGLEPTAYGDYFRATRWFGAPGNDAPGSGFSFIQTKVSSSVAHLYKRPRVWLEAFHSLGWNAQPSWIDFSTNKHFQFGGNLLCLHGLYYTTHGGWWEWAPPDFHFRMPYWPHFKNWLKSAERLSYLLSQGEHVCNVAILYPVAPMHAKTGGETEAAYTTGEKLYNHGIDFDFMDFQSLNRSQIKDSCIQVSGEKYQALVIADMTSIHFSTLEKALELFQNGGVVIGVGKLPTSSDRVGASDPEIEEIIKTIFGHSSAEACAITKPTVYKGAGVGIYYPVADQDIATFISPYIKRDFIPESEKGSVLHRKIGSNDVFLVMDVPEGTTCFFRALGKVELLIPATGKSQEIEIIRQTNEGTYLNLPLGVDQANLILFSPGEATVSAEDLEESFTREILIEGDWESELVPTMDNQWGDFRLPASKEKIGAEARTFKYKIVDGPSTEFTQKDFDDSSWEPITYSFGPRVWQLIVSEEEAHGILPQIHSGKDKIQVDGIGIEWEQYDYSLKEGVEKQPGSQGYHGLKHKVSDDFLILSEAKCYYFKTFVYSEKKSNAAIRISGMTPDRIWINNKPVNTNRVTLKKGYNTLLLYYNNTDNNQLSNTTGSHMIDQRKRSAVVIFKDGAIKKAVEPLSMKWYKQPGMLTYDLYAGEPKTAYYRFDAPPGLKSMRFKVYGSIKAYANGKVLDVEIFKTDADGLQECIVSINKSYQAISTICFEIKHQGGAYGGSAFPEPVRLNCGRGKIQTGDWSQMGVLKSYSGGMWYRKKIHLNKTQLSEELVLDLGEICATAEVHINGKQAGICMTKPFKLNISNFVTEGDNYFEILVYSTLSNHYSTIPTPNTYKKSFKAGLIGPVRIQWE